ncbi:MAG: hypothetical protein HYU28_00075 [Actinobacteria bacterium]|nr:hypothetical protein [Actinomycetota bacterium]
MAVTSSDGVEIGLSEERWMHILAGHPELANFLDAVLETVRAPALRVPGRNEGEEWFYLDGVGPSRWLKVVVRYEAGRGGWIVTAFARRSMP